MNARDLEGAVGCNMVACLGLWCVARTMTLQSAPVQPGEQVHCTVSGVRYTA